MKKAKSGKRGSATRGSGRLKKTAMKKAVSKKALPKRDAPRTVDEYVASASGPARSALNTMRAAIRSVVTAEATELISYQIPAFKNKKVIVWYAAFSNHCSLFPTAAVIEAFKSELKDFSTSKGTIHFPADKPLPVALIKRLVRARLAHI